MKSPIGKICIFVLFCLLITSCKPSSEQITGIPSITWTVTQNLTHTPTNTLYPSPSYNTIAAGILSVSGNRLPVFGDGLKLILVMDANNRPMDGYLLIHFKNYMSPTSKKGLVYIANAMVICDSSTRTELGLVNPMVNIDQFTSKGIQIWVTDRGIPITTKILSILEFMIEINQYQNP
jgi:hypothetical protein